MEDQHNDEIPDEPTTVSGESAGESAPVEDVVPTTGLVTDEVISTADESSVEATPNESVEEIPIINKHVLVDKDLRMPKNKQSDYLVPLAVLRVTLDQFREKSKDYPKIDPRIDTQMQEWVMAVEDSQKSAMVNGVFDDVCNRAGSLWAQSVDNEGISLSAGRPTASLAAGEKLTGVKAIMKMQNALGMGSMIQVPCWHSGIWVKISPPTDIQLLNMERRMAQEKINLGRATNGLIFSHTSVYTINQVMTLLFDCIHDVTIKDHTNEILLEHIKVPDLMILVMGLACTIYPNGFEYRVPCTDYPEKCKHIEIENVNLARMFFYDRTAITAEQSKHMARRSHKYTLEEIQAYQKMGRSGDGKVIELNPRIKMVLRVPTIADYINSGYRWVEAIEKMVSEVIVHRPTDDEKNDFITQHSIATLFRQYGHWVDRIIYKETNDGEAFEVDDRPTIEELLSMFSSDQTIVQTFFDAVKVFIEETTMAIVARPSYTCPACKKPMSQEETRHPNLVPIDPISTFFTLVHRRLDRTRL